MAFIEESIQLAASPVDFHYDRRVKGRKHAPQEIQRDIGGAPSFDLRDGGPTDARLPGEVGLPPAAPAS